jgi:hypothetical protein
MGQLIVNSVPLAILGAVACRLFRDTRPGLISRSKDISSVAAAFAGKDGLATPICLETPAGDPDEHSQCDKEADFYSYQCPSHCREHWQLFATRLFSRRLRRCWMSGGERRPEGATSLASSRIQCVIAADASRRRPESSCAGPLQIIWRSA